MKPLATVLSLVSLTLVACSTPTKEPSLVGDYGVPHPSYSPMWLHLSADGTFVLKTGYDIPVDIGGGKRGFIREERGRWVLAHPGYAIATVDASQTPAPRYFITLMNDTPRGPGVFISTDRDEVPDWQSIERFLVPKGPNQPTQPTSGLAPGHG